MMKVILLKDVPGQGKAGDVLNVADGYARNYLLPRGLATPATDGKINELARQRQADDLKQQKLEQAAAEMARRLAGVTVAIQARTGEAGRLFGSVNNKDIADALAGQHGIKLDKKKLVLKEPIRQLGAYSVPARLHPSVQAEIRVEVVREDEV